MRHGITKDGQAAKQSQENYERMRQSKSERLQREALERMRQQTREAEAARQVRVRPQLPKSGAAEGGWQTIGE